MTLWFRAPKDITDDMFEDSFVNLSAIDKMLQDCQEQKSESQSCSKILDQRGNVSCPKTPNMDVNRDKTRNKRTSSVRVCSSCQVTNSIVQIMMNHPLFQILTLTVFKTKVLWPRKTRRAAILKLPSNHKKSCGSSTFAPVKNSLTLLSTTHFRRLPLRTWSKWPKLWKWWWKTRANFRFRRP